MCIPVKCLKYEKIFQKLTVNHSYHVHGLKSAYGGGVSRRLSNTCNVYVAHWTMRWQNSKFLTICSDILVKTFCRSQPLLASETLDYTRAPLLNLDGTVNELDAIINCGDSHIKVDFAPCFVSQTSVILWKPLLKISTMTYLIIQWGNLDVLGHIHDE